MSVADILERAADLIEPEGAWTQVNGPHKGTAKNRCCAYIAIARTGGKGRIAASDFFARLIGSRSNWDSDIWEWNDAPGRTQAEVVARLREAAAKARESAS